MYRCVMGEELLRRTNTYFIGTGAKEWWYQSKENVVSQITEGLTLTILLDGGEAAPAS